MENTNKTLSERKDFQGGVGWEPGSLHPLPMLAGSLPSFLRPSGKAARQHPGGELGGGGGPGRRLHSEGSGMPTRPGD